MKFFILVFMVGLVLPISTAHAQSLGSTGGYESTGVRVFASPGEATVQVLVLNSMGGSGVFEVGLDTKIDELLVASGMTLTAQSTEERRLVTVRLYREEGRQRTLVYEEPLETMLTEPVNHPRFEEGDVLVVETVIKKKAFTWREGLSLLTSASSILLLVLRLQELF